MNKNKEGGICCSYLHCKNRYYSQNPKENVSFFRFPKDKYRCKLWKAACGRDDLVWDSHYLNKNKRVCSKHFDDDMFLNFEKKKLLSSAVPKYCDLPSTSGTSHYESENSDIACSSKNIKEIFSTIKSEPKLEICHTHFQVQSQQCEKVEPTDFVETIKGLNDYKEVDDVDKIKTEMLHEECDLPSIKSEDELEWIQQQPSNYVYDT